jgi:type I restriction enzyme, R subunit
VAYKLLDDAMKTEFNRNLVKQKSFQERIERYLSKYHSKFEDYDTVMERLQDVAKEITLESKREEKPNLSDEEITFYDIVSKGKKLF